MREQAMNKEFYAVSDPYRINPISLKPGGSIVSIHFADGRRLSYDKIKNPDRYFLAIISRLSGLQLHTFYDIKEGHISQLMPHFKSFWVDGDCFLNLGKLAQHAA